MSSSSPFLIEEEWLFLPLNRHMCHTGVLWQGKEGRKEMKNRMKTKNDYKFCKKLWVSCGVFFFFDAVFLFPLGTGIYLILPTELSPCQSRTCRARGSTFQLVMIWNWADSLSIHNKKRPPKASIYYVRLSHIWTQKLKLKNPFPSVR